MANLEYEKAHQAEYPVIAGVDEAGRGPLAGPVIAGAVILPREFDAEGLIDDSKKLTAKQRDRAFEQITAKCIWGVGEVSPAEIDEINILQATMKAMRLAVEALRVKPDFLLIDGNYYSNVGIPFETIVKGDSKSLSIAAASIIAKVFRDRYMTEIAEKKYPGYGFAQHKGYPTKKHFEFIKKNGISDIHRITFLRKFASRETLIYEKI